jgi:hypothetical protein
VLPTYAHALHVKRVALSRWEARGLLDEPFTTFTAAGERFLPGFRVRALPSAEERDRVLAAALEAADVPAFRAVADRIGFRARLLRLLKEVKQSGLPVEEALARLEASAPRLGEGARERLAGFLAAARAYEGLLARAGLEDHEDALRRLLESLRARRPERPPRLLAVDGFDDFTPVEETILDVLADAVTATGGSVLVTLPWDASRPRLFEGSAAARSRLLARGFAEERLDGFPRRPGGPLARLAAGLFGEPRGPVEGGDEVRLLVAGDPEDEADLVAREIRRAVEGPDPLVRGFRDVAIVVRDAAEAAPRFEAALDRLGVPVRTLGAGRPLAAAPWVRALRGPLRVLGGGGAAEAFDPHETSAFLRWRAVASRTPPPAEAVDGLEMDFREKGFPADWAGYLARSPPSVRAALDPIEAFRARLAAARGAAAVHALLEEALDALAPLPAPSGLDADGRPLDPAADGRLAGAAAARDRVLAILRDQRAAAARAGRAERATAAEAVEDLLQAVERATLALPDRRLEAVSLLGAEEARTWEMPLVFVAGLVEGGFPRRPSEDVILGDDDRAAILAADGALRLPLARDRETRERRLFYAAVTRARRRLVLVRPAYDGDGGAKSPSLFLRDLERVVALPRAASPRAPGRAAPDRADCRTREDWRRFAAAALRREDAPDEDRRLAVAILDADPRGIRGRAGRWRRRDADALPPGDAALARFRASVRPASPSSLNGAVACLHRHFLARVVGVPEDQAPLGGPTFDVRERGRRVHRAFRLALLRPDATPAEIALEVARDATGLSEGARGLLVGEIARIVALFREREASLPPVLVPLEDALELEFGEPGQPDVLLGGGATPFRLHGSVDRVDAAGGRAVIVDYKLSKGGSERGWTGAREETDLQLPLYARAVEVLRGLEVAGLEWVSATTRHRRILCDAADEALFAPRKESAAFRPLGPGEFRALLASAEARAAAVVADVEAGRHEKRPAAAAECRACAWRIVCRPDAEYLRRLVPPGEPAEEDAP